MFSELKELLSGLKEHLVLSEKLEQNKDEVLKIRKDLDKLEEKFTDFIDTVHEILEKHLKYTEEKLENIRNEAAKEREILRLTVENESLKSKHQKPPSIKKEKIKQISSNND